MDIPDPIPALKDEMARFLVASLDGWTQENAAALLETDQRRISDLRNNRLGRFSLQQLIRFASRLGADVQLSATWSGRRRWLSLQRGQLSGSGAIGVGAG